MEGLQEITIGGRDRADLEFNVEENMEHQIYRSLYEFMYAYEQIERERTKRFGHVRPTARSSSNTSSGTP